jgi:phage-related protein
MINYIVFNGKKLKDFGVYISGEGVFNAPKRSTTSVEVPGRNGTLTIDNGRYENIKVKYPAFIVRDFKERVGALRDFVLAQSGYCRLEDTYHPEEYRLAKWNTSFSVKPNEELYAGEFDLEFDCYPQRFLKEGENAIEITSSTVLINETLHTALPLIRAYGTGTFTINGVTVQITTANSYTDIDCELQECYKDTLATNCNGNVVVSEFPTLISGENSVSMSGITKLEITPRWWRL